MLNRGILYLIGIVILISVVILGLNFGFWKITDLSIAVLAGIVAGISLLSVGGFKHRFQKHESAELKIFYDPNNPDQYCFLGEKKDKKYLTVCVENKGNGIARDCKARLKITDKNGKDFPSTELKFLRWTREDTIKMTINANDKEFLNIAFSVEKPIHNMVAFVSNPASINFPENPRIKDGFGIGEYDFTVQINTEKGRSIEAQFRINVTNNWKELSMTWIN